MKIISKIVGGLGNQMFQYAIGRSMALKYNAELLLDVYDFKTYRRPYHLDNFKIQENYLPDTEAQRYRRYETRYSPAIMFENLKPITKRKYRLEKPKEYFKFIPEFLNPGHNEIVYLNGYWQNEKYFKDIRDILLNELELKPENNLNVMDIFKKTKEMDCIAVHFRRGEDQLNKSKYGVPSLEYYKEALKTIVESGIQNPHVIIFTNDPEWVKDNFTPTMSHEYAVDLGLTDFQELALMSYCNHFIVANSTFSWWGAWLGNAENKIVIAPNRCLRSGNYDTSGIYSEKWIKL
jgi:flagellar assembly factor FliW